MLMPVVDAELQLHTNLRLRNVHEQTQTQTQENTLLLRCNQHQPKKWTKNNNAKKWKSGKQAWYMNEASQEKNTYTY